LSVANCTRLTGDADMTKALPFINGSAFSILSDSTSGKSPTRRSHGLLAAAVAATVLNRARANRIRCWCGRRRRHGRLTEYDATSSCWGRRRHWCCGGCRRIGLAGCRRSWVSRCSLIRRSGRGRGIGRRSLCGGICRRGRLCDHGRREKGDGGEEDGFHANLLNNLLRNFSTRHQNALHRSWVLRFATDSIGIGDRRCIYPPVSSE
jgi:hypothetical protein